MFNIILYFIALLGVLSFMMEFIALLKFTLAILFYYIIFYLGYIL